MSKRILTVGMELASDEVRFESFSSKISLLDWDIILFKPIIYDFTLSSSEYKGKPSLDENSSFRLTDACEHWKREIKNAVDAGKTVIIFLSKIENIYIDTGQRTYSGTGKNRSTTRIVNEYSNYNCIPFDLKPIETNGTIIQLTPKGAELLSEYWSEFSSCSNYDVTLNNPSLPACLITKNGEITVGTIITANQSNGALICLPNIDFYNDDFFTDNGESWSDKGLEFSKKFVKAITSIDNILRNIGIATPEPTWASNPKYHLAIEQKLNADLMKIESQLKLIQKEKEKIISNIKDASLLRALLYEKGTRLENAVIQALKHLGFRTHRYKDKNSEFDVIFESDEGRLIGEVEGKDNRAVNIKKLRQLAMNIHEDLEREEVNKPAKGVLFGNGYRLSPIEERDSTFTDKCIESAKSSSTALIATKDLFLVAHYLANKEDAPYASKCRTTILTSSGIISFPEIPS